MSLRTTLAKPIALALAVAAVAAPATYGDTPQTADPEPYVDLRSADSRAAAIEATAERRDYVDLRSADSRAAAIDATAERRDYVDLRSPDARDAGDDVGATPAPPSSEPSAAESSSFSWRDAAIGAGGAVVLFAIGFGIFTIVRRRQGGVRRSDAPVTAG